MNIEASGKGLRIMGVELIQGENDADIIVIKLPLWRDKLNLAPLRYILAGVSDKETRAEQLLERQVLDDHIALLWTVGSDWTAVAGALYLELMGRDESGTVQAKWLSLQPVRVKPSLGNGDLPQRDILQQYLDSVRTLAQQAQAAEQAAGQAAGQAAAAAARAEQAADGVKRDADRATAAATTATTKAGEAAGSVGAAAAKASAAAVSAGQAEQSRLAAENARVDIDTGLLSKLPIEDAKALLKSASVDEHTGTLYFPRYDGTTVAVATKLGKAVARLALVGEEIALTLVDGTEQRVSLHDLLQVYSGAATDTIDITVNGSTIKAQLRVGSVTVDALSPVLRKVIDDKVTSGQAGNAGEILFADGQTVQQKLDSGALNGEDGTPGRDGINGQDGVDGVAIVQNGMFYLRVSPDGSLMVGVPDGVSKPPLQIRNGSLIYTI